jgi:predicted nuclease of predicted toxin-antitoxin system
MPSDIKLLIDEDVHLALAEALRRRGHDAIHVREVDRLGLDDESQLEYAAEHHRCFVTFNVGEFCGVAR